MTSTKPLPSSIQTTKGLIWAMASIVIGAFCTVLPQAARAEVLINEFMADNETTLQTVAGQPADWIELINTSAEPVDVGGWYLTDKATSPTKWRIPDGTTISANGYLLIFADSSPLSLTNGELHASFSLSKDGEYLGLIKPDGMTIANEFAPVFPLQMQDVSYGRGGSPEREFVGAATPNRFRVPNSDGTAPWINGTGALGFSGAQGSFTVQYYEMNATVGDVNAAERMAASPSSWKTDRTYPIVTHYEVIDFQANSSAGSFTKNSVFPGHTFISENRDNFVVVAKGTISLPTAGMWTFAVGSDDGFRLRIQGHGAEFVSEFATGRSFDTSLATFNFPIAGSYEVTLVFFEGGGDAGLEFSAAQGYQTTFSPAVFKLTGDPEGSILHTGAIGSLIDTDVAASMRNVNSRLDAEWTFSLNEIPAVDDKVRLYVRCADGFRASLNGTVLGSLNAPASPAWNSSATAIRTLADAMQWLTFEVPNSLFVTGDNVLTISAFNNTAVDVDFLIAPRLSLRTPQVFPAFFKQPTPRAANADGFTAPTTTVTVSEPRGYRKTAFTVSLACTNPGALIRYTIDGSVPTTNSPLFSTPIPVNKTTTLRASVVEEGTIRQNVTTVTWLFLEEILRQTTTPPTGWPANRQVNNHVMEYGMNQTILANDGARLRQAMTNAIPSISLVTDLKNLFSPQSGIYVNPGNDGFAWERPVSVELIDPVHGSSSEFHIDAGMRIRGAFSRSTDNPKHSLRLFFRSDYGDGKLAFPLFGSEGATEFDKVDLRTSQNYSWAFENSTLDTFIRETFSRDSQRDMGMPYTRSRYYHLYINGRYWGLYQTQERGDADYAATYLKGENDDWDCIKTSQPGYTTTANDGTFDAFYALHNIAVNQGFSGAYANNYYRVRGLNPDGTRNPAHPIYLDQDNLIVYMLIAYFTGDPDSPISIWGGMPNNMYGLFNRVTPGGFQWLRHDAEHSLGARTDFPVTCDITAAGANFTSRESFNPATLHLRLCQHPEYRRRFADLVQKHLFGDGALNPTNSIQRFRDRMNEIDMAIIGESARWGRGKTRDATWLPACNTVLNNYLPQRRDIVVSQFRANGWLPQINAPEYSVMNQTVPAGQQLEVFGDTTFYYTTNGADPRLPDGSINPSAFAVHSKGPQVLVSRGADWRYYDAGNEPAASAGLTWRDLGYPDSSWAHGPAILGYAGTATANPVATVTRRYVSGTSGPQVTTTYLRRHFTLDTLYGTGNLPLELLRDDGAIVYLNGTEIARGNMNGGATTYATYATGTIGSPEQNTYYNMAPSAAHLLRTGTNVLAVELHQGSDTSSDVYFDLSLTATGAVSKATASFAVNQTMTIKARGFNGSDWSALSENTLTVERPPMNYAALRITELMFSPPVPAGSTNTSDDFTWMELRNTGTNGLDLDGISFGAGITHTFAPFMLAPNGRVVLVKNLGAFASRYQTNGLQLIPWTSGKLASGGELLSLFDPNTNKILSFTYSGSWYPTTKGGGASLVAVDLGAEEAAWSTAANWRPSAVGFGTPGVNEAPSLTNARMTSASQLQLDASSLEGTVELWFSSDLATWSRCDAGAWSKDGGALSVNLAHASFPSGGGLFFQVRLTSN